MGDGTVRYSAGGVSALFHRSAHLPNDLPERTVVEDLLENLRPDDVFYDLGANRGIYTCLGGKALPRGRIVAFEPDPHVASDLRANVTLNELQSVVDVYQVAVADESDRAEFVISPNSTDSSLAVSETCNEETRIEVDTAALDSFREQNELRVPDVLKIDVEGAERLALRGMSSLLEGSTPRLIYCEVHTDATEGPNDKADSVESTLRANGFEITTLFERTNQQYLLKATR